MGTRNLTVVYKDGTHKVAQYGQWDGYPSGQGLTCLRFLQKMDKQTFMQQLDTKVGWATPEDVAAKHPYNNRDVALGILELIYNSECELKIVDKIEFGKDSLFCEYAYVIDLDKDTFEIYEGFNIDKLESTERFYTEQPKEGEYFGVKLIKTYPLGALPTEEEFLQELEGEDDE
jgi:hypothetical protein